MQKFSKCHGVKYLKTHSAKIRMITKQLRITCVNLLRAYLMKTLILNKSENVDKTALHQCYFQKNLSNGDERTMAGFKDTESRLTVFECTNSARKIKK